MKTIYVDGKSLSIDVVNEVALNKNIKVKIKDSAKTKIIKARKLIEKMVKDNKVVYGLTTGFGEFKSVVIDPKQTEELQTNLIISHSIGVGEAFDEPTIRAAALIRANSLVQGNSGIRVETIESVLDIINSNIFPYIPSQGSVGASGDLSPLSHMILCRMGLGEAWVLGKRESSESVLKKLNLKPLVLTSKEGLALNNGTAFMSSIACLNIKKAEKLIKLSDISAAMSLESAMGTLTAYDSKIHKLRPHSGQIKTSNNVRKICKNSEIMESHKNCNRVQDSYSLRCVPQVHGAVKDTLNYVKSVISTEINSVTDNPLIFCETNQVLSGGNFHGEPIAFVMDFLSIAISELANISDRRIFKLLTSYTSEGLPSFLIPSKNAGLSSGYMIAQYTTAALISENKVLSHPASVDSIPTSADQEDHVSFGMTSAKKCRTIINNVEQVLSIELMCAAQALDFRKPLNAGEGSRVSHKNIRKVISHLETDRVLYKDLEKVNEITDKIILDVEKAVGKLEV